ncbi:bifunctional pyr operon transcriptional regulator/uracil phosphoribosyltransferase PyrR [bacterium]|nr:bifunctional pyr operon transcriptional regulator/uracil phosphoribosyltransferase PyrR [bacterium]
MSDKFKLKAELMNAEDFARTIHRLAHELVERNRGVKNLGIVGIRTRGAFIAQRLRSNILEIEGVEVPLGILDATLYRDDFRRKLKQPVVRVTDIPFDIDEMNLIVVDDVLFTGRTVRAALDELMDFGRPAQIQLAIFIDRGHRELPIAPDFVGRHVPTSIGEEVQVRMKEYDGEDKVLLVERVEN